MAAQRMSKLHFTSVAALLAITISANALAADRESLPPRETEGRQIGGQCLKDIQAFDRKLAEVGFGVLPPGGYGRAATSNYTGSYIYGVESTPRQKIYSLRDAAYVYALSRDEESCQRVLSTMRSIYEQHQKPVGMEADNRDQRVAWRRAHLDTAQPVTGMTRLMRAHIVIGAEIRTLKDEKVGEIEDLVLDPVRQTIAYALVSRGGFMGIGEKLVAVRWKDLRVTKDHEIYVLKTSGPAFGKAPTVDRRNFEKTADPDWRQKLDRFWDKNLAQ
mgnify:FL=1|tara:strand:- start:2638 stop:3459 length:822 start_codon:yes stop_codon:yes gene_type:complete